MSIIEYNRPFYETYGIYVEEAKRILKADTKEIKFNIDDVVSLKDSYELGPGVIIDKWVGIRNGRHGYLVAFSSGFEPPYFCIKKFYVLCEDIMIKNPRFIGELFIDPNFTFGVEGKEKLIFKLKDSEGY